MQKNIPKGTPGQSQQKAGKQEKKGKDGVGISPNIMAKSKALAITVPTDSGLTLVSMNE